MNTISSGYQINNICENCSKQDVCSKKEDAQKLVAYWNDRLSLLENKHLKIKMSCEFFSLQEYKNKGSE